MFVYILIAHISASISARILYDQLLYTTHDTHHVLLYLITILYYVYINATLVRLDLNTGERLPEGDRTVRISRSLIDSHLLEPQTSPRRF
jgi:predicted lysophospholipase L1 biosynthesis ABC-type transport system permease subunit